MADSTLTKHHTTGSLELSYSQQEIEHRIFTIRGTQVMLDRDLAELYQIKTIALNQAVKRNAARFPESFRFQLTPSETDELITKCDRFQPLKHSPTTPYAFTEQGVAMLSAVLRSDVAVHLSVQIIEAFVAMRRFIVANAGILQRLDALEQFRIETKQEIAAIGHNFETLLNRLDNGSVKPQQGIFFDGQIFDAYTFINDRIREAKKRIVLIDNYVDDSVLAMLDKRNKGVSAKIYTRNISHQLSLDFEKHNAQYAPIEVEPFDRAHDRFLCIDDTVYLIGASLKDLGKKWFGFVKLEQPTDELLSKM